MKPVNIFDLSQIEDYQIFKEYSSVLRGSKKNPPKDSDQEALIGLVRNLNAGYKDLNDFYFSYSIPQISKEFDLIKIEVENSSSNEIKGIVNIELKKGNKSEEEIKKQLIQNQYYLGHISKNISSFTYVMETNKVYVLEGDILEETTFEYLSEKIKSINYCYSDNINLLFKPTQYLISPVNNQRQFLNGEYFLTGDQEKKFEDIKSVIEKKSCNTSIFLDVTGSAGTGKTLLLYHIAKYYCDQKKVAIISCGKLPEITILKEGLKLDIDFIGEYKELNQDDKKKICSYDLVLVDETQRMYSEQFSFIVEAIYERKSCCILFHDGKQVLSNRELARKNVERIREVSSNSFELKKKIRTNKSMAMFIKKLFNLNEDVGDSNKFDCVDIIYSKGIDEAKKVIWHYRIYDYKFINHTGNYASRPQRTYFDNFSCYEESNAHGVVGQEFDKVIVVLNEDFVYDENGKLKAKKHPTDDYLYTNMLFQEVTRAREKLIILVVGNVELFKKINSIKFDNLA